ncbi:HlyD family efflux transporter periplasmic adaptor subunit [Ruegeria arenilitoris]|uniref:HlyD family efflux transporter periplasmic adaptor subunit n=1 Tax=Ruegeria arenilitoris TaxID=1173585 RepID=UPI0020C1F884|nr:HlyD family efflux transporter periplasmic adaptor subunit [Ruegeria arenilitoris]
MTKGSQSNETPTDAARARQIRGWIDGKLKRLAGRGVLGGLGSTLLALPALAQATSEQLEEFQFASAILGVKGVKLLSNGDVQLTMIDGRTLIVSAEDVEILDSGAIMIADDIAAQFAQFAVVGEAGAAAAAAEAAGTTAAGTAATGAAAAGAAAAAVGGIGATGLALGGLGLAGAAAAVSSAGSGDNSGDDDDRQTVDLPDLNLAGLQSGAISNTSTNYTAPEGTTSVEVTIGEVTKTTTLDDEGAWSVSLTEEEALPALQDRASRAQIRAPVRGIVNRVHRTTIGGLARSGEELIEIVPLDDSLLVEAYVRPKDIAFLHAGQSVKVKITAYDFSRYGSLDGEIIRIGADTITRSERSEEEVFVVEIRTSSTILDAGGEAVEIIPGMIAEVDILSGQKTVLDYLIQPVLKVKESAFRE